MPTLPAIKDADPRALLRIYLSDHLAGSTLGAELAKRATRNNRGTELGAFLGRLTTEILEDRETLQQVMTHLGASGSWLKQTLGAVAERGGRLKLNGQLLGYSPLSRLVELEGLCAGVETKLNLWRSLDVAQLGSALPDDVDLDALIASAERQREELETWRQRAAKEAFSAS